MLVPSTVFLSLSTCALAVNVRYDSGYAYGYGNVETNSAINVGTSSPSAYPDSKPTSTHEQNAVSTYTPHATHAHGASDIAYPTGADDYTTPKPGPTYAANISCAPYWLEEIKHQGVASFNPSPESYQVFRNVKDW